jgi:hypothetical protein
MSPTKNHILINLSSSDKTSVGKEDFASQSLPQKVFSTIWVVESEVNNGGFSQYFLNSSAETAPFVVEALRIIEAPDTAAICERAIAAAFPRGLPESEDAIRLVASELPDEVLEKLEALTKEFFSYPHDLTELLFAYVSDHPEEFGALPKPANG